MKFSELGSLTKDDRQKIIDIFMEDTVRVYPNDDKESLDFFITKLEDDCEDCFYDHTVPIRKILEELSCVPIGFKFNNDHYEDGDVNTYYGIWFLKLPQQLAGSGITK